MKRLALVVLTLMVSVGLVLTAPLAAEAKTKKKHRDTPGCVTQAEYRAARGGMTQARVAAIFDTWGRTRFYNDHGFWQGQWVADGHWVSDGYWDYTYDDSFNIIGESWVDTSYYEDDSYWNDNAYWEPMVDVVRTYKKCRTFNHGRGRVAINFDTYTREWIARPALAYKNPSDPSFMDVAAYFRKGARLAGKEVPTALSKSQVPRPTEPTSPKPAPEPTTPKPIGSHS